MAFKEKNYRTGFEPLVKFTKILTSELERKSQNSYQYY